VQPGDDRHVDVARPAAAALGEQHHRQELLARQLEQPVGLLVVAHALRSREDRGVVGHHDRARSFGAERLAVDAADARDHAVGGRVADQVIELAPAALRREREGAVFNEAAVIAQVGDVLARRAQAEAVSLGDGIGSTGIGEQRLARLQLAQVGAQQVRWRLRRCAIAGVRGRRGRAQRRQHRSGLDDITDAVAQRFDHTVARRMHLVLHLHRLDDDDEGAASHAGARLDVDGNDAAGERRDDLQGRHGEFLSPRARRRGSGRWSGRRARSRRCAPR